MRRQLASWNLARRATLLCAFRAQFAAFTPTPTPTAKLCELRQFELSLSLALQVALTQKASSVSRRRH